MRKSRTTTTPFRRRRCTVTKSWYDCFWIGVRTSTPNAERTVTLCRRHHRTATQMTITRQGGARQCRGRYHYNALQAAQLLLDRGADVNSKEGLYGNALQAASMGGHEEVGRFLRNEGTVNVQADFYARALREALSRI
jgi:hypothetical protein